MKLYYDKRLKDPTYYVQEGIRNGKKTTTRNVKKLGKHSELLMVTDDPVSYCRNVIQKMNEDARSGKREYTLTVDFNQRVTGPDDSRVSRSLSSNIGYFYLQYIYNMLELDGFFRNLQEKSKAKYDFNSVNRFLTFGRILDPHSKYGTYDRLNTYYENPQIEYHHFLRFLDLIAENQEDYLAHLYKKSQNLIKRDMSVVYYDCTNYFFECEQADDDEIDPETGEVTKGLRRYGVSKENRPNPIVEMGLLMDKRGIPISMCLDPGNTSEQETATPLEEQVIKTMGNSKFIYCADAGLGSYNIRKFNSMGGRAFIVTQSVKKLSDALQTAVFNDCDYRNLSDDNPVSIEELKTFKYDKNSELNRARYESTAYKVLNADKEDIFLGYYEMKKCKNGKIRKVKAKGTLKQIVIVTFSRKMMDYQRKVRQRQIDRAKKLISSGDPEKIKKGPNDVRRFIKNKNKTKSAYILDEEQIRKEEQYDGYYAVATNLVLDPVKDILDISHKRYQIEDCFRIMKTTFKARPVYVYNPNRIRAHFLTCFTALLVYRLLECMLDDQGTHVTVEELIETLKNMNVVNEHDVYYSATYTSSYTLKALEQLTELGLDFQYYKPKDLNKILRKISKKFLKRQSHTTKN